MATSYHTSGDYMDLDTAYNDAVIVTHAEVMTIHGEDNDSVDVTLDVDSEGSEIMITQDGASILLSFDEAVALCGVLQAYVQSGE